jgi:uracil-DNA glycosylase
MEDIIGEVKAWLSFFGSIGIEGIPLKRTDSKVMFVAADVLSEEAREQLKKIIKAMKMEEKEAIVETLSGMDKAITLVKPRVIVAMGDGAATALLRGAVSALRGRFHPYRGINVMSTHHPQTLLERTELKAETWEDMKMVMGEIGNEG